MSPKDRFWDDAVEYLLTLPTAEAREEYMSGYGLHTSCCLRVILDVRMKQVLAEIQEQLLEE